MAANFDLQEPRSALANIAHDFHRRGWMPGTAGNLSVRVPGGDADCFWITGSGMPKGQLEAQDFLLIRVSDGAVLERGRAGLKPSAETSIHLAIYATVPAAQACLHVHSVDACIALDRVATNAQAMRLPPLEIIKCFDVWEQDPHVDVPVFENWLDVPRIGAEISARFTAHAPEFSALGIRRHGMTVWGGSLQQAYNRVEAMEFILSYMARV